MATSERHIKRRQISHTDCQSLLLCYAKFHHQQSVSAMPKSSSSRRDCSEDIDDYLSSLLRKTHLGSNYHGDQTASIILGKGDDSKTFVIHTKILTSTSKFFKEALRSCKGDNKNKILLGDHCPLAFEVVYRYLYSGDIWDTKFKRGGLRTDCFWFRIFNIAHLTDLDDLTKGVYTYIKHKIFCTWDTLPSQPFVHELYEHDCKHYPLRQYIIAVYAYNMFHISRRDQNASSMNYLLRREPRFAREVLRQIILLGDPSCTCWKDPKQNPRFDVPAYDYFEECQAHEQEEADQRAWEEEQDGEKERHGR